MFYDPMLAKVISYAPTRRQAAGVLADALARTRIHGVRTNRDLLVNVLRHPGVPRRRDRHRVLRHPRPGRAGRAAGRSTRRRVVGAGRRAGRRGRESQELQRYSPPHRAAGATSRRASRRSRYSDSAGETHEVRYRFTRGGAGTARPRRGEPGIGVARPGGAVDRRRGPPVRRRPIRRRRVRRLPARPGATRRAAPLPRSDSRARARFPARPDARFGAAHRRRGRRHRHRGPAADLAGSHEDGAHRGRAERRCARRTQRRTGPAGRGRRRTRPCGRSAQGDAK